MTSRERVKKTLRHEAVDRAPRQLWVLKGNRMMRPEVVDEIESRYPNDIVGADFSYGPSERAKGEPYELGSYTDAWGCVWEVGERGVNGEVRNPILTDWSALKSYTPPFEILEKADFSRVNEGCAKADGYVKPGSEVRPFERAQFLRGTENLLLDLAYGTPEVMRLLEMLHDFFCRELELWAATDVDGVQFMDDWGSQTALLISPPMWREIFKPMYKDYCEILHGGGKDVWFHSDGNIRSIYPDLIEVGIDAVNSQLFCMDIEELASSFNGKITFWGEIDRQWVLPFGTAEDVRAAVRRVRKAMDTGCGGVIAQCEMGLLDPKENILALFDEWMK